MGINSTDDHQNVSTSTLDTEVPVDHSGSEPMIDHIASASKNTQTLTNLSASKNDPMLPPCTYVKKAAVKFNDDSRCKIHKRYWVKQKNERKSRLLNYVKFLSTEQS